MKVLARVLRFGPNELDLRSFELKRAGRRLPLSKIPMELLALLLERPGMLVTREQIAARLWTHPEALDTERGINSAINRIRQVLNDDAARPRFIETVIGVGYRFIAPVEEVSAPEPALSVPALDPIIDEGSLSQVTAGQIDAPPQRTPFRSLRRLTWALSAGVMLPVLLFLVLRTDLAKRKKWEATELTTDLGENQVTAAAISPDGKLVAYADADGWFLRVVATGSSHPLKRTAELRVSRIEWFPDDIHLLVSSFNTASSRQQIWLCSIVDNEAHVIREDAENATPSPGGPALAFTAKNGSEIWMAESGGEDARLFKKAGTGEVLSFLFWANGGNRLSFVVRRFAPGKGNPSSRGLDADFVWDYGSLDARTGKQLAVEKNVPIESACAAPGNRILYVFKGEANRGKLTAIWEVETDASTGAFVSRPKQLASWDGNLAHGLTVTSDGSTMAAIQGGGQPDVYVADMAEPGPRLLNVRRLTSDAKRDFPHAWTPDSQAVVFESDRTGRYQIYQQPLGSRVAEALAETQEHQVLPQLTPDGQWLLFASFKAGASLKNQKLYRMRIKGGGPQEVPLGKPLDEFRCGSIPGASCVLRETVPGSQFVYYALDPVKGKGRELARTTWVVNLFGDWALSPDGKTVAVPYHDPDRREFRLVPLDGSRSRREQEIKVSGTGSIWGISWAMDGKSWFADSRLGYNHALIQIDQAGRAQVLRETADETWAVAAPDGHKIAFVDYTLDGNVWLWH